MFKAGPGRGRFLLNPQRWPRGKMSQRDKDANKIMGMVVEALEDDDVLQTIDEVGDEYRPECRDIKPNVNKLMKSRIVQGVLKTLVTRMVDAMTFANGNEDDGSAQDTGDHENDLTPFDVPLRLDESTEETPAESRVSRRTARKSRASRRKRG